MMGIRRFIKYPLCLCLLFGCLCIANKAHAGGTHFLIQIQGGFALPPSSDMGLALGYGLQAGWGGRLRGTPVRFYGVFAFDRTSFNSEPVTNWTAERSYNDFQVGIRMLLPVYFRLRWYIEVLAGGSIISGQYHRDDLFDARARGGSFLITTTTGFEVRYHRNVATGVRAEMRWNPRADDVIPMIVGQETAREARFAFFATQSFMF